MASSHTAFAGTDALGHRQTPDVSYAATGNRATSGNDITGTAGHHVAIEHPRR